MNYATERLLAAAKASLAYMDDARTYTKHNPDEAEAAREELESALFYFDAHGETQLATRPPRVLVHLDGGLVQDIIADAPVHAVVIDYDVEGADVAELFDVPQAGGSISEACRGDWGIIKPGDGDASFIDGALAAQPTDPEAHAAMWAAIDKGNAHSQAAA
jgi:hypothetical protein